MSADPIKIMLVDDNPTDIFLIKKAFSEDAAYCEFSSANDGEEALKILLQYLENDIEKLPHLILSDINMPRKDGHIFLKEIKSNEHLMHIPVLMFTSSNSARDVSKAYASFCNGYIVKPSTIGELKDAMRNILAFWSATATLPRLSEISK